MSDEISNLELSPTMSTLSGVSEPAHYLPMSVGRRGTVTSLTSSSSGHTRSTANGQTTPTPRSASLRSRALSLSHHYLPNRGSPPPPLPTGLHSPALSSNPPPSYHNSPPLAPMRKAMAPPPPVAFASLMLLGTDRIRIAGFPDTCEELVRHVLSKGWTGVEGKRNPSPGVFEWKLAKAPCE